MHCTVSLRYIPQSHRNHGDSLIYQFITSYYLYLSVDIVSIMPLFGKKKNDGKKPYPTQQAAYPTQQAAYPTAAQPAYNPPIAPVNQQQMYSAPPPGAGYAGAPPAYSAAPPPAAQAGYPQAPVYYQPPPPQTVVVNGGFDAGARFNSRNPPTVPPPPPGCAPNAAQMASSSGQNVVMGQKPSNWVTGGSDGGYTLW